MTTRWPGKATAANWPAVGLPKKGMQIIKNDLELPPECANIFLTM